MKKRLILILFELLAVIAFNAAAPIYNAGNVFGIAFFSILIFITLLYDAVKKLWHTAVGKALISLFSVTVIAGALYSGYLSFLMIDAIHDKPDAPGTIIVLGCQVNGVTPSSMLKRRLDTAYDALCRYPDAECILSGGRGSGEGVTEAKCMYDYLVNKGVDPDRLIMEDRSTSTSENIRYSFELTDDRDITIVSDGFHQYRAGLIAEYEGAHTVNALSADTELRFLPTYWVREWFGITYFKLFKK